MKKHYPTAVLLIAWMIVQGILLWKNGIVTGLEAEKYIYQAQYFLDNGNFSSNNYWLYSTQIFLIAAAKKLQLGYSVIVSVQLLLNLLATLVFYKLCVLLLKNTFFASLATLAFIVNLPYQVYNSYLFTESIFYSLSVIYSSYLLRLTKLNAASILILCSLLLILSITRPTGILFFAATVIYVFFKFIATISLWERIFNLFCAATVFTIVMNIMLQSGGSLDFMLPFKRENIICGVNTTATDVNIKTIDNGNSLQGIFFYINNNQQHFLRLAKLKTAAFFGLLRNYYSPLHNFLLCLFFYPFYILSFIGAWKMLRRKEQSLFYLLAIILLYWITTVLTCDDWHNRFVLTVFPFIFLIGFSAFIKNKPLFQKHEETI